MVRLFSTFFEYKAGSIPKAERSLNMLSGSQQRDYRQFIYDQSQNTNLSEEYRNCWAEMESIIDALLGAGK
jgi:hypothetical protein